MPKALRILILCFAASQLLPESSSAQGFGGGSGGSALLQFRLFQLFVQNPQGRQRTQELAGQAGNAVIAALPGGRRPAVEGDGAPSAVATADPARCEQLPPGVICEEAPAEAVGITPLPPPPAPEGQAAAQNRAE